VMEKKGIEQASQDCGVPREIIIRFIEEEWIHPLDLNETFLDDEDIARIRLIWELHKDFGVNDESMSIILHLLDQLNRMHLELEKFRIH
jgi:chaperone modulatory protein CbpM